MPASEPHPAPLSPAHLAGLVARFEALTIPLAEFHHREHLLVALYYALHHPPDEAMHRMRTGLQRLLAAGNKPPSAYQEDLTALWMARAHTFLAAHPLAPAALHPIALYQDWLQHAAAYPPASSS